MQSRITNLINSIVNLYFVKRVSFTHLFSKRTTSAHVRVGFFITGCVVPVIISVLPCFLPDACKTIRERGELLDAISSFNNRRNNAGLHCLKCSTSKRLIDYYLCCKREIEREGGKTAFHLMAKHTNPKIIFCHTCKNHHSQFVLIIISSSFLF